MLIDTIEDCSKRGDIVLACFGGYGSALIAAERIKRKARVIDPDPLQIDLIIPRWQEMTGRPAIHAESGLSFDEFSNKGGQR